MARVWLARGGPKRITEYGGREERQVQKCKSADGRCKGGKVEAEKSAEYRVRSADLGGMR